MAIQATFISENKLQTEQFLAKPECFFTDLFIHFELLLGWECAYVCDKLKLEKKVFEKNSQNIKQKIDLYFENKPWKVHFFANYERALF